MKEIRIEELDASSDLHLCDSCLFEFATCPGKVLVWGDGIGNDNVVACLSYDPIEIRYYEKLNA